MKYNFDEVISRENTNSMKINGYRDYLFPDNPNIEIPFKDEELVKMWIADMEFATPEVVIDEMRKRLDNRIFGYSKVFENNYYEAFLDWCKKKYSWSFPKDDLFTSPGIIPALYELVGLLTKEDEKVVFCTPSYAYFEKAALFNNREYLTSPLIEKDNRIVMNFEQIDEYTKDPKVKIFILCNPYNPNGIIWTKEELEKIGEICIKNDCWLISDEIHCDLIRSNKKHEPMAKVCPDYDKIITCMAPSKTFNLAGLMMSNIIIQNDELKKKWKEHHFMMENPISIAASYAAYAYGEEWLDELKTYLDGNFKYLKEFLDEYFPKAKFEIPDATYLAWINLGDYIDVNQDLTAFFAQKAGVLLESGSQFVSNGEGYIRLNLACPRAMLVETMDRIKKVLL